MSFSGFFKIRNPANNGVGGVIIASAIIAGVGMARGVGLALLSPFTNAGGNGDSDICRFREPAGGVVSWSRLLPQQQYFGVRIMVMIFQRCCCYRWRG